MCSRVGREAGNGRWQWAARNRKRFLSSLILFSHSGATVTSSWQTDSKCAADRVLRSSAKPIKRARSQRRLMRRAMPQVS
ncbi:MAG: hypothetical protein ABSA26_16940 [Thermoguttaceae bacterium]